MLNQRQTIDKLYALTHDIFTTKLQVNDGRVGKKKT